MRQNLVVCLSVSSMQTRPSSRSVIYGICILTLKTILGW